MTPQRYGALAAAAAYLAWGFFPLYWPLLLPASAPEIAAHRIVWSLGLLAVLITLRRRGLGLRGLGARRLGLLTIAAAVIAVNWVVYIYGVNSGRVVETSLGYFINPLVTVLLGVVVLGERLRPAQWVALVLGAAAVADLTVDYGRPPWIALVLAVSFATYGFVKKRASVGALESLTVETAVLAPAAAAYLALAPVTFGRYGAAHALLLVGAGVVTVVPLLLFGAAATRVPLSTIGLLQYLTPSLQFLLGITVFHEPMPVARLVGFGLVWLALLVFSVDALNGRRRSWRSPGPQLLERA